MFKEFLGGIKDKERKNTDKEKKNAGEVSEKSRNGGGAWRKISLNGPDIMVAWDSWHQ